MGQKKYREREQREEITNTECWHEENGQRQTSVLNTVVRDSLGASVSCYVITQLRSCPIEQLGQYLGGTCSHHSSVQFYVAAGYKIKLAAILLVTMLTLLNFILNPFSTIPSYRIMRDFMEYVLFQTLSVIEDPLYVVAMVSAELVLTNTRKNGRIF